MMEKMTDPNIIDYNIINCAITSIISISQSKIVTKSILASLSATQAVLTVPVHYLIGANSIQLLGYYFTNLQSKTDHYCNTIMKES